MIDREEASILVDVVIVTTNRRDLVLRSLEDLTDPAIAHIIVVVNASRDGTSEAIRQRFPEVMLVELERTESLPFTNNRGAERATADYILFLNDDILPTDGAITTLAQTLAVGTDAVAAGGRLVNPDDLTTQPEYRPRTFPTLLVFATQLLLVERLWPGNPVTQRHWGAHLDDQTTVETEQPPGACLLVRRSVFDAVGGYDEKFWVWYEDSDLLRRLADRGRILYVPSAVFRHLGGSSVRRWSQHEIVRSRFQGVFRYAEVHFSRRAQVALSLMALLGSVPRWLLFHHTRPDVARAYRAVTSAALSLMRGVQVPPLV